ncbi:hypothetical protein GWK47_026549 [Chionoecetes opilio]|uniref:Uncharacterized protein n=1 Tax=Chionoecetes opilio TaxID=41210 RepID=A0A8J8WA56_CHIOP|nr:hypothetical protein GWK47_026549 [Chionoecetes opilio]
MGSGPVRALHRPTTGHQPSPALPSQHGHHRAAIVTFYITSMDTNPHVRTNLATFISDSTYHQCPWTHPGRLTNALLPSEPLQISKGTKIKKADQILPFLVTISWATSGACRALYGGVYGSVLSGILLPWVEIKDSCLDVGTSSEGRQANNLTCAPPWRLWGFKQRKKRLHNIDFTILDSTTVSTPHLPIDE